MVSLYQTAAHLEQTAGDEIMRPSSEQTLVSISLLIYMRVHVIFFYCIPNTCLQNTGLLSASKQTM